MNSPALIGFATSLGLILAIGAQNAYVLRQGLKREYVGPIVAFCAISDALLILLGVWAAETISSQMEGFSYWLKIIGVAFLIVYGLMRFGAALKGEEIVESTQKAPSLLKALAICAALTYLNPHVYVDTIAIIGSLSLPYQGSDKIAFATGAMMGSLVFFTSLGYGARFLSPIFKSPLAWRVLDFLMGCLMLYLAWHLWQSA